MKWLHKFSIRTFRQQLASFDSVPQFALLGLAAGFVTGLVIIAFRLMIEWPLGYLLTGSAENFESLPVGMLLFLPVAGAVVLALIAGFFNDTDRRVGVVHVLERLARHQGHMPLKNAAIQFVTGVIALASGQPGGREGPANSSRLTCRWLPDVRCGIDNGGLNKASRHRPKRTTHVF